MHHDQRYIAMHRVVSSGIPSRQSAWPDKHTFRRFPARQNVAHARYAEGGARYALYYIVTPALVGGVIRKSNDNSRSIGV